MLKKSIAPLVLAAFATISTAALAATQIKTGDVKSTDATKHQLTLATGDTFEVGSHVRLAKFKAGDKVAVTYDIKDGRMIATKVHHTK